MNTFPQPSLTPIKIYLCYRTGLAALLTGLFFTGLGENILGTYAPEMYVWSAFSYLILSIVSIVVSSPQNILRSKTLLSQSLIIDVVAVLAMLHASGGINSGLGYLLLVGIAFAGVFLPGQLAIAFAAMTSLLVIAETLYMGQITQSDSKAVVSSGFLGILIFFAAYAFQFLTEKVRASSMEAAVQAQVAEHLQRLAQAIIVRMRTGIIVVDSDGVIELINDSALQLMGLPKQRDYRNVRLSEICSLQKIIDQWRDEDIQGPAKIQEVRTGQEARVSLSSLELGSHTRTVIYLEDHRALAQQAQHLKLASLGRLTASIAHEIRNPLGAISHAAQLLAESEHIHDSDKRLTDIINQHSHRVNDIVQSTLALSSRKDARPVTLELNDWLQQFVEQYSTGQELDIQVATSEREHLVRMDPTHLSQVLTNLLDNGLRHSYSDTGESKVQLNVKSSEHDDTSYIEVIDFGKGIEDERITDIFEPFFTTEQKGSGLGLYISKELCQINQANLYYLKTDEGQSCFRIEFSHYQRMF